MVIPDVHSLGRMLEGYNQKKPRVFGSGALCSNNHEAMSETCSPGILENLDFFVPQKLSNS